jgi:hypothetical protein
MTTPTNATVVGPLSVPAAYGTPRPLNDNEIELLTAVARALIPAHHSYPSAADEPDLVPKLTTAANARADAFTQLTEGLNQLAGHTRSPSLHDLRLFAANHPQAFSIIATVVSGAWLLTAATRDRIDYHGQRTDRAALEDAADELSSGILDPVLAMDDENAPRWYRG